MQVHTRIVASDSTTSLPTDTEYYYHKQCYTTYTSQRNLSFLNIESAAAPETESASTSAEPDAVPQEPTRKKLRSSTTSYGLRSQKCIFCLKDNKKQSLHSVMTTDMINKIQRHNLLEAHNDIDLHTRLSSDLLAIEAKYHSTCQLAYMHKTNSAVPIVGTENQTEACFTEFLTRVDSILARGRAVEVSALTEIINQIQLDNCKDDAAKPREYRNDRLKLKLKAHYDDKIVVHTPNNRRKPELIYSSSISLDQVLHYAASITDQAPSDAAVGASTPSAEAVITHAAAIIRTEIESSPFAIESLSDVTWTKAQRVVPGSLLLLLRELGHTSPAKIFSIGQDVMCYRKSARTPKSVGLAVLVKNWTNNSSLIDHLHRLGHCCSYKDVLSFDNSVADSVLTTAMGVGHVIPSNIQPRMSGGGFIHCAADNIDFTEETLDGSGTTHATSAVLYQRHTGGKSVYNKE